MGLFYENKLKVKLSWWERRSLFSLWLVFNMLTAVLVITGSFGKMFLEFEVIVLGHCRDD